MIGFILWQAPGEGQRAVDTGEKIVLQMRFFSVGIRPGKAPILRHRIRTAAKLLRRAGITQVVLPENFPYGAQLAKYGVFPVSTLPLRRSLAVELVRIARPGGGAKVAVAGAYPTEELTRAVTEIALRSRYLLLSLPYGGEELCRRLRREYGVSPLLNPEREQVAQADVLVLFSRREDLQNTTVVPLYEGAEDVVIPPLQLSPELERQLPHGCDRLQLFAALQAGGAVRREEITVGAAARTGLDIPQPSPYNTTL